MPAAVVVVAAAYLTIMTLAVNALILTRDFLVNTRPLLTAHMTVGTRPTLHVINAVLPAIESARFGARQIARAHATVDTMLLAILARIHPITTALCHGRHRQRAGRNYGAKRNECFHDQTPVQCV